jgi:hypothetical protein
MPAPHLLTPDEIREIGEALYGRSWQGAMAKAIGVPRQSIGYYLKSGQVTGTQATAILGLIARTAALERRLSQAHQSASDSRQATLLALLDRLEPQVE